MDDAIAPAADVPADGTLLFTIRDGAETVEAVLTRDGDTVVAYRNYCKHWTDVRLDTGDGALVRDDELVCQRHGATFARDSGRCTFGPCEGAVLDAVAVEVRDGTVHLAEDGWSVVGRGGDPDRDRSSGSRVGFGGT